jgi:hypothetical protein
MMSRQPPIPGDWDIGNLLNNHTEISDLRSYLEAAATSHEIPTRFLRKPPKA